MASRAAAHVTIVVRDINTAAHFLAAQRYGRFSSAEVCLEHLLETHNVPTQSLRDAKAILEARAQPGTPAPSPAPPPRTRFERPATRGEKRCAAPEPPLRAKSVYLKHVLYVRACLRSLQRPKRIAPANTCHDANAFCRSFAFRAHGACGAVAARTASLLANRSPFAKPSRASDF